MNSAERSRLQQVLISRRQAIADSWYKAIAQTSDVPLSAAEVRQRRAELTEQVIALLLVERFEHGQAQSIGESLARLHYVQPEALGRTQEVLAQQLVEGLPADRVAALLPRLAALLGGLAAGFVEQASETTLAELEQRVEERTVELAAANEQLTREVAERKRAECELEERRLYLEGVLGAAPDAIVTLDAHHRIVEWNRGAERLFGYSPEEVMGQSIDDLISRSDVIEEAVGFTQIVMGGGGVLPIEAVRYRKDGSPVSVILAGSPILVRDEFIGAVAVYTDITERKRAEKELIRMSNAVRMSMDSIVISDLEGKIIDVNEATLKGYGTDDEGDLIGKNCFDLIAPEDREKAFACMEEVLEKGYSGGREYHIITKDGSRTPVEISVAIVKDVDGKPTGFVGITRGITERKRAEEELIRMSNAVRMSMDSIVISDLEGKIIDVNEATLKGYGTDDKGDLIGRNSFDLIAPEDREKAFADMEEEVLEKGYSGGREYHIITKDGGRTPVEMSVAMVKDVDGKPTGFVGITRDITERKRAEKALKEYSERLEEMVEERTQELRDAQEQLVRQEKLAVLGHLAGGVAHELRNPLGAISNAAYFLNMVTEEPDPEVKEMLEIMEKEVRTSERIISSLLDFARPKPPIRRIVDVNEVVRETLSRAAVPDNVEVVRQLEEPLPTILADPDQLVQVFGNIILNAVQVMTLPSAAGIPDGGRLVVKTSAPTRLSSAEASVEQSGVSGRGDPAGRPQWVTVSFTDTGEGIPEENLEKIFEPLFTTKATGIGLGLALAKRLVEGHGGSIEVKAEMKKGSTFTIRLPFGGEGEEWR